MMTWRSILLGLALGVFVAGATYFNDTIIGQTMLIGNYLPVSVIGVVVGLLLGVNPLLRLVPRGWGLRPAEIVVITAVALAACAWPGSNCFRYFTPITAMPGRINQTNTAWQAIEVMSYLPGGSGLLAPGQVADWRALARAVTQASGGSAARAQPLLHRLWRVASDQERQQWAAAAQAPRLSDRDTRALLAAVNRELADPACWDAATLGPLPPGTDSHTRIRRERRMLAQALPQLVRPLPAGSGALLAGGRSNTPALNGLVQGLNTSGLLPLNQIPWRLWWPTLRLWGGTILLLGLASWCLALIVHRQWSQHELLPYPIAHFITHINARTAAPAAEGRFPAASSDPAPAADAAVLHSRLFWAGFAIVFLIHLLGGLHAWYPNVPYVPLRFDFQPLRQLFPGIARAPQSYFLFLPTLYPTIIAFTFFIERSTAFTLGVANLVFVLCAALLIANGVPVHYAKFTPNNMNYLRFGAFVAAAVVLVYTGRRYYLQVARDALLPPALKLQRPAATASVRSDPPAAPADDQASVWAFRGLIGAIVLATWWLTGAGLVWYFALGLILVCLLVWLIMARIVSETGLILLSGPFLPMGILPGLVGFPAMGPTQILLLGIGGCLLLVDPRETLMPFLANGLAMTERQGVAPRQVAGPLLLMIGVSFVVALVVTLGLQYQYGLSRVDDYAHWSVPAEPFNSTVAAVNQMRASDTLQAAVAMTGWQRLKAITPDTSALTWVGLGLGLYLLVALARVRVPWWPLHPVVFLVWGTWAMGNFSISFFLGWAIKTAVVRLGGARAYRQVIPLAIGVIAGELCAALMWSVIGAIYFAGTHHTPARYIIFP